jgi:hypothetical protein
MGITLNKIFYTFTTPDLLWSAFPAQTPYHYAYASPLTYRDPTGLAPEKEKEGEELMSPGNLYDDNGYFIGQEIVNSSNTQNTNDNEGSAPDDLGDGGGREGRNGRSFNGSRMSAEYTDNTQTSMFQSLLAQHLDVGPTGGPMISSGGGFAGGGYDPRKTLDGADITNPVDFLSSVMGRINSYYDNYVGLLRENGFGPSARVFERGIKVWSNEDFSSFELTFYTETETFPIRDMKYNERLHLSFTMTDTKEIITDLYSKGFKLLLVNIHFHPEFSYYNGKGIVPLNTNNSMYFPIIASTPDWESAKNNYFMNYEFNPTNLIIRDDMIYQYGYDKIGIPYIREFKWK